MHLRATGAPKHLLCPSCVLGTGSYSLAWQTNQLPKRGRAELGGELRRQGWRGLWGTGCGKGMVRAREEVSGGWGQREDMVGDEAERV